MRQNEIVNGVDLIDEDGRKLTKSKVYLFVINNDFTQNVHNLCILCILSN